MLVDLFFKGLLAGLLVSVPVGPMAVLVIQRTANRDLKSGIYSGLGIAVTDTIWALFAGFSVSYIISFLREHQAVIQIIGAIALFVLGFYIFNSHPVSAVRKFKRKGASPVKCFFSAFAFALSNPVILLAYIVVFASTNIVFNIHHLASPIVFVTGFLSGAMGWWVFISLTVNRFRHHFNLNILWWFNKVSGSFIMVFVVVLVLKVVFTGNLPI